MPGNDTIIKSVRQFLPVYWKQVNFVAGQATPVAMLITGFPSGVDELSIPRRMSLVSAGIMLSSAVTTGLIRFELIKNGSGVGVTVDMNSTTGARHIWELNPGRVVFDKGDSVGVQWGSSGSLAPSGINGVLFMETEPT